MEIRRKTVNIGKLNKKLLETMEAKDLLQFLRATKTRDQVQQIEYRQWENPSWQWSVKTRKWNNVATFTHKQHRNCSSHLT